MPILAKSPAPVDSVSSRFSEFFTGPRDESPCHDPIDEPSRPESESITIGRLADFYPGEPASPDAPVYVEHRVGGEIIAFQPFLTAKDAREHAAALFGPGGFDPTALTPSEIAEHCGTMSAIEYGWGLINSADVDEAEAETRVELGLLF